MKNDPIIHAKASKIVEAIMKSMFGTELPETSRMQWYRDVITEALYSLESSEREVLEGFAHFINTEYNLNMSIQSHIIDRYLAEKQSKTEKK